jgi:hypothetical protein
MGYDCPSGETMRDRPLRGGLFKPAAILRAALLPPLRTTSSDAGSRPAEHSPFPGQRPDTGRLLLLLALTLLVYVAAIPRILLDSSPPTGDQPFYLMDAISIVQDHDLNLTNNYANHDFDKFYGLAPHPAGFVGINAPYPLPPQVAVTPARPPTEEYSYHLPGLGLALAPAWLIGSWFSLWWPATIVFMCLIGALLAVNTFLFAYEVTGRLFVSLAVWASMAFSGPIFTYSLLIFTELPCGLLLLYSFRRLALGWQANGQLRRVIIGLCIAYIPWLAWRCLPISIGLLLYALAQCRRAGPVPPEGSRRATGQLPRMLREMVPIGLPIIISACLLVLYCRYLFAQPYPSSVVAGQGPPVFHWPWRGTGEFTLFVTGAFAIFFDRQWGLLPYTPVYLLAVVGILLMARTGNRDQRRLLLWGAVVSVPYALLIASFDYWGGLWCPPARYLTTLVPLLAAPLAVSLTSKSRAYAAMYAVLTAIGFAFILLMLQNPHLMFPVDRSYLLSWLSTDPASPLHLDLLPFLPAFAWPDPSTQPFVTGRVFAVAFGCVLLCYLLVTRGDGRVRKARWSLLLAVPPWLAGAATVFAGWHVANDQFLQHQTVLTEQRRWVLTPAPIQLTAAAVSGDRLFLTDYGHGGVDVLNLRTGRFTPFQLTFAGRRVPYFHPGSIVIGPDGLLYLLNNGPGNQALYLARPSGELVRAEPLKGMRPIAVGLAVSARRGLYVTDMTAGAIRRYRPGGGAQLTAWTGVGKILNNIAGILPGPDGLVYVAESSANRVLAFDASGHLVQAYNLTCSPRQLAGERNWIDVICGTGLISIDTNSHTLQESHLAAHDSPLSSPTALAYGSGGTLYIADGDEVVAYSVQR